MMYLNKPGLGGILLCTRKFCVWLLFVCGFFLAQVITAQVTYDSNATVIGATSNATSVQSTFGVPSGDGRILVAFVMRDGGGSETDSITFDNQKLTMVVNQPGSDAKNAELWSLTLGCGPVISDVINAFFTGSPDVSVAVATFQNVDQFDVIGSTNSSA